LGSSADDKTTLAFKNCETPNDGKLASRFNCYLKATSCTNVCVAAAGGRLQKSARAIDVPCLVNFEALRKGEELVLEIYEKVEQPVAKKLRWRDADQLAEATAAKKHKGDPKRKADWQELATGGSM
jgi:hypothetical protein